MPEQYYLDTCIWRDFYENRIGLHGKPLGKYAAELIAKIIKNKDLVFYSELTLTELRKDYSEQEVNDMLAVLFKTRLLKEAAIEETDFEHAKKIAKEKSIPLPDAIHGIICKRNNLIFVSQDFHAQLLKDIVKVKRPEEIKFSSREL